MAKNIVFVLHGIGQYTDGWMSLESCAVPMLKTVSKDYAFFESKSLDTFTDFTPILYDDVFERILARKRSQRSYKPAQSGYFHAYANDAWNFYENNRGSVKFKVSR